MKVPDAQLWDKFWSGKEPSKIYPPVTNISEELRRFTEIKKKRILEVGSGTGRDGLKLTGIGGDVYLLDFSQESLRMAKAQQKNREVKLILADARRTPFKDNAFDIIFHQGLLEHFPSPYRLLQENYRILRPKGLLLVDVPQTYHIYTIIKHILIFLKCWFGGWERQFTIKSLANLLKKNGFSPLYYYGDWSRPGVLYKIIRQILYKASIRLPMYPVYFKKPTQFFYSIQTRLRRKKIFLYTFLSVGIIARK